MPDPQKLKQLLKELEKFKAIESNGVLGGLIYDLMEKFKGVEELEAKFDRTIEEIKSSVPDLNTMFKSVKGNKGDPPTREELLNLIEPLIPEPIKGDKGDDYILTEYDKRNIAEKIKVPIVEKIVETIIEKQPIITNEVKEVAVADTPEMIVSKLESLEEGERLKISAIEDLRDELDRLRKQVTQKVYVGGGGGSGVMGGHVQYYDLSSQLNGSLRVFSVPAFARILNVQLSSFPNILRPTVDWTSDAAAMTLTLTSEIPDQSLSAGQTLVILYANL